MEDEKKRGGRKERREGKKKTGEREGFEWKIGK